MKSVLIGIFFLGAVMAGMAFAQNSIPQTPQSPSAPQTSTPNPSQMPAAAPETEPQTQSPQASTSSNPAVTRVAPGSVIPVQLTKSIDAKKAKPGDEVVARVTEDMKTDTGMVLVPKDTKVIGHVTEAQSRSKEQKESEVGIAFDHAVIKNGSEMQMPMSIQAVIALPNPNSAQASGSADQQPSGMGGTATPSAAGGRSPGMGSGAPSPSTASPSTPAPNMPSNGGTSADGQTGSATNGPISAKTQGVVGISNLKLMTASASSTQGSLLTSEKNNVKLESGTLMLLRVN
jgi:hypothetical protein